MVIMPGRCQRSASSKQVAEMTKDVGCAIARAVAGCGEANLISEYSSNTRELDTTDRQRHCVFRAGHGLPREHVWREDHRAARHTAPNHERTIQQRTKPQLTWYGYGYAKFEQNLEITVSRSLTSHS